MKYVVGSFLLLAFALTLALPGLSAESVQGTLINQNNNRPIANWRLSIGDYRAQTDAHGNFVILIEPGLYPIQVQGYRIRRVQGSNTNLTSKMKVLPRATNKILIFVSP